MLTKRLNELNDSVGTKLTKDVADQNAAELTGYLYPINGSKFMSVERGSSYTVVQTQGVFPGSHDRENFYAD